MKKYYYQIIPLTRIPIDREPFFTYQSPEEISFGSLVLVPFRNKKVKGIVLKKQTKPTFKTRKITTIKTIDLINKNQLELAKKISAYYFTSLGVVLNFFVFNITKKIPEPKKETITPDNSVQLTSSQKKVLKKVLNPTTRFKKYLIFGPASSGKTEIAMSLIENNLKQNKQSLVVLPEIFLSYQEIYRYKKRFFNKNIALLHSKLKPSEISSIWKNIKSGKIDVLITTKTGCFMPFKNLGAIIVDEEQDISHKNWDKNPKYHVEKIAEWLAQQHRASTIFLSATPSVKNYWQAKNKKNDWQLLKLPPLKTAKIKILKPEIKIIDLWEKSYQKFGDILLSKELLTDLKLTTQKNKISVILVPYHGKSQAVFCENCKTTLKCPRCETSLINIKDEYQCLHCNYKISSLSNCPNCKSYKLKNVGFGTESVAKEINDLFPDKKTVLINKSSFEKNTTREKLFKKIKENKIDFLIGNQTIAKGFDFPNIGLVAVLNAQRWTGKADYKFDERWLGIFFQIGGRINRPHSDQKGIFYIQTFKSNLKILENLKKWSWENFAEDELLNRQSLKYPPFKKIYRLTFKDIQKQKVEKTTKKVYNQLQAEMARTDLKIFEPFYSFVKKKGIFWNKHILIKTAPEKKLPQLEKRLKKLSASWSIDPDPENIF
jgi:primosomal protein N' (replication factor Y)